MRDLTDLTFFPNEGSIVMCLCDVMSRPHQFHKQADICHAAIHQRYNLAAMTALERVWAKDCLLYKESMVCLPNSEGSHTRLWVTRPGYDPDTLDKRDFYTTYLMIDMCTGTPTPCGVLSSVSRRTGHSWPQGLLCYSATTGLDHT